jgi:hypothetical protein
MRSGLASLPLYSLTVFTWVGAHATATKKTISPMMTYI